MAAEPPARGPDADPGSTYAAVGRAISAWEQLEARLADLYSIFVGEPQSTRAFIRYGREARTFKERMAALSCVASRHLLDQGKEADFDGLLAEVQELSMFRNRIAHGVVAAIPIHGSTPETSFAATGAVGWFLVPPWYALYPLTKTTDEVYFYNSARIDAVAGDFAACGAKLRGYRASLDAHWQELPEPFGLCVWLGTPRRLSPGG